MNNLTILKIKKSIWTNLTISKISKALVKLPKDLYQPSINMDGTSSLLTTTKICSGRRYYFIA